MGTALQRQLSALGWRALGFGLALLVLTGVVAFWGRGIEGRIERVDVERHHDHKLIIRLAQGKPLRPRRHELQVNSKKLQNLEQQAGGEAEAEAPKPAKPPGGKSDVGTREPKAMHHSEPSKPRKTKPVEPAPAPASVPESTTSSTPPPEEPGNSGDTPAAENSDGLKACVDVAVSACVKAELP